MGRMVELGVFSRGSFTFLQKFRSQNHIAIGKSPVPAPLIFLVRRLQLDICLGCAAVLLESLSQHVTRGRVIRQQPYGLLKFRRRFRQIALFAKDGAQVAMGFARIGARLECTS